MASRRRLTRQLPRAALSILLGAVLAVAAVSPALANPDQVPDPGARPAPAVPVQLPDGSTAATLPETPVGPLAAEIAEVELEIATRATELAMLEPELAPTTSTVELALAAWDEAAAELAAAEEAFQAIVDEAFRGSAGVPPHLFGPRLRGLSAHAPLGVDAPLGAEAAAQRLTAAQEAEAATAEAYGAALLGEAELADRVATLETELAELGEELSSLHERNTAGRAEAEREREADEQRRAPSDYPVNAPVGGHQASDKALAAVAFALAQLGKPYQWGAQGPDRYDCSGLMWDAYRSVGVSIPRVAADQYWGTRDRLVTRSATVAQRGLLPGDLVFFSPDPYSWQSIGHVGMYIGDGRMVHAPTTGDVVKVAPVWWARFFAATRVVDAVPDPNAPSPSPTPSPSATPTPRPTPSPTTPGPTTPGPSTPGPSPTPSSPTPTGSPSPSPTPSVSPSPTPSQSPTPGPSPSPTPTQSSPTPSSPSQSAPNQSPSSPSPSGGSPPATTSGTPTATAAGRQTRRPARGGASLDE